MKQYLKMADVRDLFDGIVADGHELWCENGWTGEMLDHKSAEYTVHAITSHDELVQINQELLAALEECAKELTWMLDKHNEQSMEDGSWLYDHQTPWEAMQLVHKAKGDAA